MDPLVCQDPIAGRRFNYGQAALIEGDARAAAELFEQTAELVPAWAPVWFALGQAREALGEIDAARVAYRRARSLDEQDKMGAELRLALIEKRQVNTLPSAYISRLFDDYAERFDVHLRTQLNYRVPEIIAAALDEVASGRRFERAIDLGCGSGLTGISVAARVDHLVGVDLSSKMIEKARLTGLYDSLEVNDILMFLGSQPSRSIDLAVSADVFGYIGELAETVELIANVLKPTGLLAFTVEKGDRLFEMSSNLRFVHSESYVRSVLETCGMTVELLAEAAIRREAGADVPGFVVVAGKR